MLCPLRTERGYPPRSAPKFGCAGQVQRRQDLPNCKNFRQDLTTILKITVDNILTKHELQVRQPVAFVTSGCSDVVKLEGVPQSVPPNRVSNRRPARPSEYRYSEARVGRRLTQTPVAPCSERA